MKNPITHLDDLLVSRVFQPVVDLTQRQPAWCARQSILMSGLALLVMASVYGWRWPIALALIIVPLMLPFTFSPGVIAILGALRGLRIGLLLVTAVLWALFFFILPSSGGAQWLRTLYDASQLALLYFAACRPPKPKEPRTVMKRAAA